MTESSSLSAFPSEQNRVTEIVAALFGLAYALILLPPWIPAFLTSAEFRDPSWRYMLHEGFVQQLEFGRDIIFTYGPFGFLTTRMYHPETYNLMLWVWIGLSLLFFAVTWKMARRHCRSPWMALLVTVIAVRVAFVEAMIFLFAFLILLPAWRLAEDVRRRKKGAIPKSRTDQVLFTLLLLTVGLLPLTKYTFVPATAFVIAVLAVIDAWQKKIPLHSITVAAGTLGVWLLSGQPAAGIAAYISAGFEVAHKYTDAMTNWETDPFDKGLVIIAAALIPVVPLVCRHRVQHQHPLKSPVYPFMMFTLLFLVFKFTCVGFHAHKLPIYFGSAFLIALFSMLATCGHIDIRNRWHAGTTAVTGLLFTFVLGASYTRFIETDHSVAALLALGNPQNPAALRSWIRNDPWMQAEHESNFDEIRRMHPLPNLNGTIDVVPDKLAMAIADEGARFVPRPLLHTYATHSPWLAEQNAAHYRSPDGPDNVLFRVNPLIGRFPTLNDGRLWLELFRSFDVREDLGTDLLLCRRPVERNLHTEPLQTVTAAWRKPISVPSMDGMIWCRVRMEPTTIGRLAAFGYKLPEIWMDVREIGSESVTTYRFTTQSGASGFLLSPVMHRKEDLAAILNSPNSRPLPTDLSDARLESICFHTSDTAAEHFYSETFTVEFERIHINDTASVAHEKPPRSTRR